MNFSLRNVVARMSDFVRVLEEVMVSLSIANTNNKNHVEMLFGATKFPELG